MNTVNLTRLLFIATFLLVPITVFAENQAEHLEKLAKSFLQQHYSKTKDFSRTEIKINPISRQINLRKCLQPINFQTPKGNSSRITLRARCPEPYWQLFIVAQVKHFGPAIISNQSIARNSKITSSQITLSEIELTNLRSAYFSKTEQIIGWISKRPLPAGTIITANMLKQPLAIDKGDAVMIEAKRNGVSIRAAGTALQGGMIGKQISVRNDRSGKEIKAIVIHSGLVRTP